MWLLLIVVILLALLWVFRGALLAGPLARAASAAMSDALGGQFEIDRIEGSYFGDLVILGCRTKEEPTKGTLRSLSFKRAEVDFELFDFFGDHPLDAIKSVILEDGQAKLDLTEPAPEDEEPPPTLREIANLIPTTMPEVAIRLDLEMKLPEGMVSLQGIKVASEDGRRLKLNMRAPRLPAAWSSKIPALKDIALSVERPDKDSLRIHFPSPQLEGAHLQSIEASLDDSDQPSAAIEARVAEGTVRATLTKGALKAQLSSLQVASLIRMAAGVLPEDMTLPTDGSLTINANWNDALSTPERVNAEVTAQAIGFADKKLGKVDLRAAMRWNGGTGVVDSLNAVLGATKIEGSMLSIDPSLPWFLSELGKLEATVPDLVALLAMGDIQNADLAKLKTPASLSLLMRGTPEALEVTQFSANWEETHLTASGAVTLPAQPKDWEQSSINLHAVAKVPDLNLLKPWLSELPQQIKTFSGSLEVKASVTGQAGTPQADLNVNGQALRLNDQDLGNLLIEANANLPMVSVAALSVDGPKLKVVGAGQANIDTLEISASDTKLSIADLSVLAPWLPADAPTLAGRLSMEGSAKHASGTAWSEGWDAKFSVAGEQLVADAKKLGQLNANANLLNKTLTLQTLMLAGEVFNFTTAGVVELDPRYPGLEFPQFDLAVADLGKLTALLPLEQELGGSVTLTGNLRKPVATPWATVEGDVVIAGERLIVDSLNLHSARIQMEAHGREFALKQVRASGPDGNLTLIAKGKVQEDGSGFATIQTLDAQISEYPLRLLAPLNVTWTKDSHIAVNEFQLEALGGNVTGTASLSEVLSARLGFEGLELSAVPGLTVLKGRLSAKLDLQGKPERPSINLTVDAPSLTYGDKYPIAAHAEITQTEQGLVLKSLTARSGTETTLKAQAQAPFFVGSTGLSDGAMNEIALSLSAAISDLPLLYEFGLPPSVAFDSAQVNATLNQGKISVEGSILAPRAEIDNRSLALGKALTLNARSDANSTRFDANLVEPNDISLSSSGSLNRGLDLQRLDESLEQIGQAALQAKLRAAVPKLSAFSGWVPGLVRQVGSLDADISVTGTPVAPTFTGAIIGAGLGFKPEGDVPGLDDGTLRIRLSERLVTLETFEGKLGYSPLRASGTARFPQGADPIIDFAIEGENALLARNRDLRLRADLDLKIKGALNEMGVSGIINITDALYSQPVDLFAGSSAATADDELQLFSFRKPPLSGLQFDLAIRSDKGIRVDNNLVRGRISTDLTLKGTGAVPKPQGRVFFSDLDVILPFSKLNVTRGDVLFDPDQPFAPRLAIAAATKMRGYALDVTVQGRLPDQQVIVRSDPFIPQEDAYLLLVTGATPAGLREEGLSRAALTRIGSLVGDSVLSNMFGPSDPDEETFADRFELEVGRDVSRTGASTIEAEYKLLEKMFLRAERDRYDNFNAGLVWRLRFR